MVNIVLNMVPYPSGKGKVCKTLIHRFESDWHLLQPLSDQRLFLFRKKIHVFETLLEL